MCWTRIHSLCIRRTRIEDPWDEYSICYSLILFLDILGIPKYRKSARTSLSMYCTWMLIFTKLRNWLQFYGGQNTWGPASLALAIWKVRQHYCFMVSTTPSELGNGRCIDTCEIEIILPLYGCAARTDSLPWYAVHRGNPSCDITCVVEINVEQCGQKMFLSCIIYGYK